MSQNESEYFNKFLQTITQIEKNREFDRKVDRLKKSSSATTFWAVFGGIFGIYGLSHFYLNRPLEGLVILLVGIIPSFFTINLFIWFLPGFLILNFDFLGLSSSDVIVMSYVMVAIRISFFVGNIISARYQYSRYDFYIHLKAKKPWNNWGLNSQM